LMPGNAAVAESSNDMATSTVNCISEHCSFDAWKCGCGRIICSK
jgi:hypothetical protein